MKTTREIAEAITVSADVTKEFWEAIKNLHENYNCVLNSYEEKETYITLEISGKEEDMKNLVNKCQAIVYEGLR